MESTTCHIPVMPTEVMESLQLCPGKVAADGTLGGGGHCRLMAQAVGDSGCVIAVDRDPDAITRAETALAGLPVMLAHRSFADLPEVLHEAGYQQCDAVLLDLGLSSDQLADRDRGFSFHGDGTLDMRFDSEAGKTCWQLLERISAEHLADLIFQYGEERYSRRIARAICEQRRKTPIREATQLAEIVRRAVPAAARHLKLDPATKTFQALRIAINDELKHLELALRRIPEILRPGGRFAIISFHSLEDRIVKQAFRSDDRLTALHRKPILPSDDEIARNARSRSAKLRVAERTVADEATTHSA